LKRFHVHVFSLHCQVLLYIGGCLDIHV